MRVGDGIERHSQTCHEDLVRLAHARCKLRADKHNKTLEIVTCCTCVIGNRNLLQKCQLRQEGKY